MDGDLELGSKLPTHHKFDKTLHDDMRLPNQDDTTADGLYDSNRRNSNIKDMNDTIYKSYTGFCNERVIENLKFLLESNSSENIYVRVPHIPKYNTEKDVKITVNVLNGLGVKNIEVFTYICEE